MVSFVLISWTRYAETRFRATLATTMTRMIVKKISLLSNSWNLRIILSLQRLMSLWSLLDLILIMEVLMNKPESFVGVSLKRNCDEFITYARVTKKNTQISRLSVLSYAVCYRLWSLLIQIVAPCANIINNFARCYV